MSQCEAYLERLHSGHVSFEELARAKWAADQEVGRLRLKVVRLNNRIIELAKELDEARNATTTHYCTCGRQIEDPAERWPDAHGGVLCQECWEAACSEAWWRMAAGAEQQSDQ